MEKFKKSNSIMDGANSEWDENDHPRDDDGKFTNGGDGGATNNNDKKQNVLTKISIRGRIRSLDEAPRIQGDHSPEDDADNTNPNFGCGTEYSLNCTHCVATYELRQRGYDVEATGAKYDDIYACGEYNKLFENYSPQKVLGKSGAENKQDIICKMNSLPDGARATVNVLREKNIRHIFIVQKENKEVFFIDPQDSLCDATEIFEDISLKPYATLWARIDNLKPFHKIIDVIKERK